MNQSTSSSNKLDVLKQYKKNEYVLKLLEYTYSPYKKYHVTPATILKNPELVNDQTTCTDLFELLDNLDSRELSGHCAIKEINGFIHHFPDFEKILFLVLDRNLKIRVSSKLINKVFPNLIPTFDVSLAHRFNESKLEFSSSNWFVSRKLDGVRCICIIEKDKPVRMFSRTGKEFHTLSNIIEEIKQYFKCDSPSGMVLDGEICNIDSSQKDNFQGLMKEIRKKNHTVSEKCKYYVFDCMSLTDFVNRKSDTVFNQRLKHLDTFRNKNYKHVRFVKQHEVRSLEEIFDFFRTSKENGWEGLILRRNTCYEGKRTWNMLKLKSFTDDEYDVQNINCGKFRYVHEGKEYEEDMVTSIEIIHKGQLVKVGSGFTIQQRKQFYKQPEKLLSSKVTVQYFEETFDKNGNVSSLRFPTIKHIYLDGNRNE